MLTRLETERREQKLLAPYAFKSRNSRGRQYLEKEQIMEKQRFLIVNSALAVIKDECGKWKHLGKECGGSLLGAMINGVLVILFALRTGKNAQQSYSGITTDHHYQNEKFPPSQSLQGHLEI